MAERSKHPTHNWRIHRFNSCWMQRKIKDWKEKVGDSKTVHEGKEMDLQLTIVENELVDYTGVA